MNNLKIRLRKSYEDDAKFILSSWITSFFKGNPRLKKYTPWEVYYFQQKSKILKILSKPDTFVVVVCNPDNLDEIYGYVCYEALNHPVFHYLYVKSKYRKLGLAEKLIQTVHEVLNVQPTKDLLVTHLTKTATKQEKFNLTLVDLSTMNGDLFNG